MWRSATPLKPGKRRPEITMGNGQQESGRSFVEDEIAGTPNSRVRNVSAARRFAEKC